MSRRAVSARKLARRRVALALVFLVLAGCSSAPDRPEPPARKKPDRNACAHCGLPLGINATAWKDGLYHPPCYDAVGPRCHACTRPIRGEYVTLADRLDYHRDCFDRALRCGCCGLPVDGERSPAVTLRDGRLACKECRSSGVNDVRGAREALATARAQLRSTLGLELPRDIETPIELVSRHQLAARASGLAHPELRALTEVVEAAPNPDGTRGARAYRIYALSGLPRDLLAGVFAHELVHVLQSELGGNEARDPALCEGAAVWAQSRVLRAVGDELQADLLLRSRDPAYGEGARRFLKLATDRGQPAALEVGLKAARFPEGY